MSILSTLAFVLIVISAMVILIFRDWRINTLALAVQYLAAFALVTLSWPLGMAVVKVITGWMATAAIALTCLRQYPTETATEPNASMFFRGLSGLLVIMVIFVISPNLQENLFPSLDLVIVQGGLMMIGMALMQLGSSAEPYLTIISLLSLMGGFEVIHAGLERSTLLTGLLVIVNLGLALVGVFFIIKSGDKEKQTLTEEEVS